MRRCVLSFRVYRRPTRTDNGAGVLDEAPGDSEINEKRTRCPRGWSAICLPTLRFLQFAYFAFACYSLHAFQRSGYFREDSPWQHSRDQMRHSRRMMRWVRTQASVTLIYHALVLLVSWLCWALRSPSRPFARLITVFGDGCAMMAVLSSMVLLDGAHEGYCHSPPPRADFNPHGMFSFGGKGPHHHNVSRHRHVCRSLDVTFGLCGLVVLSHLLTAGITAWRAKQSSPLEFAKVEPTDDVEQGSVQRQAQRPGRVEAVSHAPTPQRQHSPPPPYLPIDPEPVEGHPAYAAHTDPRGRASVETTASSLGLEGYLVPDGWRAPQEPPQYSSRPSSLRNATL